MTAPTRRAVLAGLSAAGLTVPALAALPSVAGEHPDAKIFQLVQELEDARLAWEVVNGTENDLSHLAHKEYPEPPPGIRHSPITRQDGSTGYFTMPRDAIEATWWAGKTRDDAEDTRVKQARLAERDAYDAARKVIDDRYGVPETKARAKGALTNYTEAEERVYPTPAKTLPPSCAWRSNSMSIASS